MAKRRPWYETLFQRDYYDQFYVGGPIWAKDIERRTTAQVDFLVQALELRDAARVLDLCCGWGRHAVRLAQRGYKVVGLDLSAYHIRMATAAARSTGVDVEWLRADMRDVPRGPFDAVINMFTAFGYFDDEAEDQRVLDGVARSLRRGGRFIVDLINQPNLMRQFRESDWQKKPDGGYTLEQRRYNVQDGRMENEWTYVPREGRRRRHWFSHRLYTYTELAYMLTQAGLHPIRAWGNFDGSDLTMHSSRMIVMAEK